MRRDAPRMSADKPGSVPGPTAFARVAALLAEAVSRAAFFAVNLPAAFGAYERHADVAYGADPRHKLDVYVPKRTRKPEKTGESERAGGANGAPYPLVVFWHGGRWCWGDKSDYRFVGAALTELGCVAVLPNYRRYPQVKMAGFMDDAARAASWAAMHAGEFGADPNRLYLMGHSAGAHMAALVTLDSRYLATAAAATATAAAATATVAQAVPHVAGVI